MQKKNLQQHFKPGKPFMSLQSKTALGRGAPLKITSKEFQGPIIIIINLHK